MKPRLDPAPWTIEDTDIEWRNTMRHDRLAVFGFMGTQPSDRRDADLMYNMARMRIYAGTEARCCLMPNNLSWSDVGFFA